MRHHNTISRCTIEVNRIWHLINDRYNHEGKHVFAFLALQPRLQPTLYRDMIQERLYANTPDDYVQNYFEDPDPEGVQNNFRMFHVI